jgi:outer membrane protein
MQEEMNDTNNHQGNDPDQEHQHHATQDSNVSTDPAVAERALQSHKSSTLIRLTFLVALLALAGVIFLFASKSGNTKPSAKPVFATSDEGGASAAAGTRVAFVRDDSIQSNYLMTIHFLDSIERRFKSMEGDLMAKQKELEKKVNNYYRDIQSGILKESLALQIKEKLEAEGENLANLEAGYTNRMNEMQLKLNVIYFDSLWNFIERHKAEFGVDMVVGYQQGMTNIFFADNSLDITAQVIEMMNAEYIERYPDKKDLKKRKK